MIKCLRSNYTQLVIQKRKAARRASRAALVGALTAYKNLNRTPAVNLFDEVWDTLSVSVVAQAFVGPETQPGVVIATGAATSKLWKSARL
jgi:hypothetical protein